MAQKKTFKTAIFGQYMLICSKFLLKLVAFFAVTFIVCNFAS